MKRSFIMGASALVLTAALILAFALPRRTWQRVTLEILLAVGIVGATDTTGTAHGVRVMAVAPGSPAEKGGLKSSNDRAQADLIVAVDGTPVDTPDKLSDVIAKHSIGDKVKLFVLGADNKFREVTVALRPAP